MAKSVLQATIVYDSKNKSCETKCGIDWSSAKALTLANKRIKERFGNRAKLKHTDLSKQSNSKLNKLVEKEKLTLPILLIDGQLRISGEFDVRLMLDVIEAELEIKRKGEVNE